MKNAGGWAIVTDGVIDVRTVSPTPRATIVNWLVLNGIQVLRSHTDADIERKWEHRRGKSVAMEVLIVGVRNSVINSEQEGNHARDQGTESR